MTLLASDHAVLRQALEWLESGLRVQLVTVVRTFGSSPRQPGAALAIASSGAFVGSVSGGCVEEDLVARYASLGSHKPQVVTYGVSAEEARRFGLACGGTLKLVIEPMDSERGLREIVEALDRREQRIRTLDLSSGEASVRPTAGQERIVFDETRLDVTYGPRWRLLIIGAGQTSGYLAEMAQALDYHVMVCDPREEYVEQWDVPGADLLKGMPDDVVREIMPDVCTAIVALTHDPKLDDMALLEALHSEAWYVGALGSTRTNAKRRERLKEHFDLTKAELERLHGPVGLPIGSKTPAEIALAILAELTAERNGARLASAAVS
jgi:xanthine dehydrogenase accessory factor